MENLLFAVLCAVVAVAVSWGINSNKIESYKEELKAHKDEFKQLREELKCFVRRDMCENSHKYGDKEILEIKTSLKKIEDMVQRLTERE